LHSRQMCDFEIRTNLRKRAVRTCLLVGRAEGVSYVAGELYCAGKISAILELYCRISLPAWLMYKPRTQKPAYH
jgi:hypothetical protein